MKCKNLIILRSVLCEISKTLSVQEGIVLQNRFSIGIPFTESKNYYLDYNQLIHKVFYSVFVKCKSDYFVLLKNFKICVIWDL